MTAKNLPQNDATDHDAPTRSSLAPVIHIVQEIHQAIASDLDVRAKGLSADLARRVCLAAGGRLVGKRILVATKDLCAYLRANPSPAARKAAPRPAKHTATATMTAEQIALANGLRVVGGEGGR